MRLTTSHDQRVQQNKMDIIVNPPISCHLNTRHAPAIAILLSMMFDCASLTPNSDENA